MINIESPKALTKRQAQVFNLYKKNKSVKEIAKLLGIQIITVYSTIKSANNRLGLVGRLGSEKPKVETPVKPDPIANTIIINGEVYLRRAFVLSQLGVKS